MKYWLFAGEDDYDNVNGGMWNFVDSFASYEEAKARFMAGHSRQGVNYDWGQIVEVSENQPVKCWKYEPSEFGGDFDEMALH